MTKIHNISNFPATQQPQDFTLQRLMKNTILVGQCFALLPVDGITGEAADLKFKWMSFKTIYTIFAIGVQIFMSTTILVYSIKHIENFFSFVAVVWNIRSLVGIVIFLRLARKWPALLKEWRKMEDEMLRYGSLPSLRLRFKTICIVFLVFGVVEHVMYRYESLKGVLLDMKKNDNFWQKYFSTQNQGVFVYFGYSSWKIIFLEFSTLISTFLWQYCNVFVILVSSALAERFRQISIVINKKMVTTESQWKEIRKHYNMLSLLCRTLNESVAEVILLSFFGNVYFLSIAVFQSFKPRTTVQEFFFWYSIVFYMVHIINVCLYGAWVQEESVSAISEVSSLPVKNMSHDAVRILSQMSARDVAITGAGLFTVTRGVILKIMGVIVTLQLIFTEFKATF